MAQCPDLIGRFGLYWLRESPSRLSFRGVRQLTDDEESRSALKTNPSEIPLRRPTDRNDKGTGFSAACKASIRQRKGRRYMDRFSSADRTRHSYCRCFR